MWSLSPQKKDKLWVKWIHNYYLKGKKPWEVQTKKASWNVQKILQARHWLEEVGVQKESVIEANTFSIKEIYSLLKGQFDKVPQRRLICNNYGCPRWTFILYLAIQESCIQEIDWKNGALPMKQCAYYAAVKWRHTNTYSFHATHLNKYGNNS